VIAGETQPAPPPPFVPAGKPASTLSSLSQSLSYYFISGNTFTPGSNTTYFRQVTGCVNQMPENIAFSAPVHLPQGSQVVTITLYTGDIGSNSTTSTAYFIIGDGKGFNAYSISASSQPFTAAYQQNSNLTSNPWTINNSTQSYLVEWRKFGTSFLSLCGVQVAFYAPLGVASYLPAIQR